jgi:hypothetical protein
MPAEPLPKYALPEIERRWRVHEDRLPPLTQCRTRRIEDKYMEGGHLRLRKVLEDGQGPIFKLGKKYPPAPGWPAASIELHALRQRQCRAE